MESNTFLGSGYRDMNLPVDIILLHIYTHICAYYMVATGHLLPFCIVFYYF